MIAESRSIHGFIAIPLAQIGPPWMSSSEFTTLALDRCYIDRIMTLGLTEDERVALAALLKRMIEDGRYPLPPASPAQSDTGEAAIPATCRRALSRAEEI